MPPLTVANSLSCPDFNFDVLFLRGVYKEDFLLIIIIDTVNEESPTDIIILNDSPTINYELGDLINPRRACAARVTVLGL